MMARLPRYDEDTLVQRTAADYLRDALGWDVVYAYNEETFGPEGRAEDVFRHVYRAYPTIPAPYYTIQ